MPAPRTHSPPLAPPGAAPTNLVEAEAQRGAQHVAAERGGKAAVEPGQAVPRHHAAAARQQAALHPARHAHELRAGGAAGAVGEVERSRAGQQKLAALLASRSVQGAARAHRASQAAAGSPGHAKDAGSGPAQNPAPSGLAHRARGLERVREAHAGRPRRRPRQQPLRVAQLARLGPPAPLRLLGLAL